MKLNEKITYYRRRAGYSQQTLADLMGVSRQSVSKWETGDSLPEVTKLPQLAQLFGVTTDHLLSDEAPVEDAEDAFAPDAKGDDTSTFYREEPESGSSTQSTTYQSTAHQSTVDEIASHLPHFLGKLVRLYGWVAGIRIAISGVLLLAFCLVGTVMTGAFDTTASTMETQFMGSLSGFGAGEAVFYNADGSVMEDVPDELYEAIGLSRPGSSTTGSLAGSLASSLFTPIFTVLCLIGVVLILVGVALTIYLKPRLS